MKRLLLVIIFGLELLCFGSFTRSDALYKPWDSHFVPIQTAIEKTIPKVFQPKGKSVYIETINQDELSLALGLIYDYKEGVDGIDGLFLPGSNTNFPLLPASGSMIFLISEEDFDREEYVVTHEYGHFVYYEVLTDKERKAWDKLSYSLHISGRLPSPYADSNKHEAFAESFAWYVHNKPIDKSISKFLDGVKKRLS